MEFDRNDYIKELKTLIGKKVKVVDNFENTHTGRCKAINFAYLNIILETEKETIVIKNPQMISRVR